MNFLAATCNGSVSLFNGVKLLNSKQLSGHDAMVGYFNGQIVVAMSLGSLTVMNQDLGIIGKFPGSEVRGTRISINQFVERTPIWLWVTMKILFAI